MVNNIEKYKRDLSELLNMGRTLLLAVKIEYGGAEALKQAKELKVVLESLPRFDSAYQAWYSEAKALIRQLLPDRLVDFTRHYEKPRPRKEITFESYRIEDGLQGLTIRESWSKNVIAGPKAMIPHFEQQLAMLAAAERRFESSLYNIKTLVQAELFDSEIATARELHKKGFRRGAGAIAGVVLEKHLGQACRNHQVSLRKTKPTIADFNDALRKADAIDMPQWRFIQHLGDLRNLCSHAKTDPTKEQVQDLLDGVDKVMKTVY